MNCFLIDFENVKSNGLKGIERLVENDDVYIFYSEYANTMTFDIHHKINKSNANLKFFKSGIVGKNALDFQLVSYLGYLIAQKKYKQYLVITGDRGFEAAVSFWKDFFKQNQLVDLAINRFYTIQDALDKKSIPSKYYNNKKLPPTIPTVETELELRQLKATNVIVDKPSSEVDSYIKEDLNISDINTKSLKISTNDSTKDTINPTDVDVKVPSQESISTSKVKSSNSKSKQMPMQVPPVNTDSLENKPLQNVKGSNANNVSNNKKINNNNNAKQSKEDRVKSKSNNQMNANANLSKKSSNNGNNVQQSKKNNNNHNKNINSKKVQNVAPKVTKNQVSNDIKKSKNLLNDIVNDSNNVVQKIIDSIDNTSIVPKSKGFVFGKIDLNDDTSVVENIQKKPTDTTVEQTTKNNLNDVVEKKAPVIKSVDLVENISSKNVKEKEKVSIPVTEPISDTKPTQASVISTTDTSKVVNDNVSNVSNTSNEVKPKRKVGRPRKKPIQDKKEKPKNNKKFQGDIPNDKLDKMLATISKISEFAEYPKDDMVKICKIVAFSKSKQEGYQAFMSCFGKHKGVEIYKVVKQEFDALKNLYLSN